MTVDMVLSRVERAADDLISVQALVVAFLVGALCAYVIAWFTE